MGTVGTGAGSQLCVAQQSLAPSTTGTHTPFSTDSCCYYHFQSPSWVSGVTVVKHWGFWPGALAGGPSSRPASSSLPVMCLSGCSLQGTRVAGLMLS